jgi:hypothetical protein
LATLIQQWARRYERVANPHYCPRRRARIRAFYKDGVKKWRIPRAVEVLPILLHISLFVFFAGLSVFLFSLHPTIFKAVTALIGFCVISYACLSLFPIIHKNSLYSTPLSVLFSFFLTGIRYLVVHPHAFFSRSMIETAEHYAFKLDPEIDHRSLLWTFKLLDEDADLEKFFEGLPRLCDSNTAKDLKLKDFIKENKEMLSKTLIELMNRTLSSNLVEEPVKHRRMVIFTRAIESKSASLLEPSRALHDVLFGKWHGFLECIDFGLSMRHWAGAFNKVKVSSFYAQCVATRTISNIQKRDERWIELANIKANPLSKSLHNDDYHSILLTNAIYVVRMSVQTYSGLKDSPSHRHDILDVSRKTLGAVRNLDIQDTLPELQHEFCDLWNKLINMARTDQRPHPKIVASEMLKNIRKLYIALHPTQRPAFNATEAGEQVLDNANFYPECEEIGHRPSSPIPELQVNEHTEVDAPTSSEHVDFPRPQNRPT